MRLLMVDHFKFPGCSASVPLMATNCTFAAAHVRHVIEIDDLRRSRKDHAVVKRENSSFGSKSATRENSNRIFQAASPGQSAPSKTK